MLHDTSYNRQPLPRSVIETDITPPTSARVGKADVIEYSTFGEAVVLPMVNGDHFLMNAKIRNTANNYVIGDIEFALFVGSISEENSLFPRYSASTVNLGNWTIVGPAHGYYAYQAITDGSAQGEELDPNESFWQLVVKNVSAGSVNLIVVYRAKTINNRM